MNTELRESMPAGLRAEQRRRDKPSPAAFLIVWVLLIGAGAAGTVLYANHMKQSIEAGLAAQSESRMQAMQAAYEAKLADTQADYDAQLAQLQSKVDALNELLTFTKDNANTKTDNSNKLYTQLNDVKKQLDELKKNLELLK